MSNSTGSLIEGSFNRVSKLFANGAGDLSVLFEVAFVGQNDDREALLVFDSQNLVIEALDRIEAQSRSDAVDNRESLACEIQRRLKKKKKEKQMEFKKRKKKYLNGCTGLAWHCTPLGRPYRECPACTFRHQCSLAFDKNSQLSCENERDKSIKSRRRKQREKERGLRIVFSDKVVLSELNRQGGLT
jgi:hypothetical protein